jgi:hypothetical protein
MPSCEGFQKHSYKFPATQISHRLLYTTVAESCPSDDGSATAEDSNSQNLSNGNNLESMLECDEFLPAEDDFANKITHDDGTSSPSFATLSHLCACMLRFFIGEH